MYDIIDNMNNIEDFSKSEEFKNLQQDDKNNYLNVFKPAVCGNFMGIEKKQLYKCNINEKNISDAALEHIDNGYITPFVSTGFKIAKDLIKNEINK